MQTEQGRMSRIAAASRALFSTIFKSEGSYRGPATGWSHWGNPFQIELGDGFQAGLTLNRTDTRSVPAVYACVMAIAKAISICYPQHVVVGPNNKHDKSKTSPAARFLRKPNSYETWPQFILNAVATMMFEGESFILLGRDDRYAINQGHLLAPGTCSPYVDYETKAIYYSVGSNPMVLDGMSMMVPARDIIHLRRYTPRHPLIGESDIKAASLAAGINVALTQNQAMFFAQMSRPSGILSTDQALTKDQMIVLRDAFNEQAKGMNAGKIPVLANGLKFSQMSISSQDAQLVQAQRMSIEDIARVFGVPLPVIGDLTHASLNNVESMVNFWLSTGLGSILENVERSFDAAFGMGTEEYIEFDVAALLRMDFTARVEGYTKAIQGGLISPNEAREKEGFPAVDGGDTVFLQQQMVGIDMLEELHKATLAAKLRPQPKPIAEADAEAEAEAEADAEADKAIVLDWFKRKRA